MNDQDKVKTFGELDLPQMLYKYRNWNKDDHKTILTNSEIFFCPPFGLQSKDEFNLPTDYVSPTEDDILDYYYKKSFDLKTYLTPRQRFDFAKESLKNAPFTKPELRKKIEKEFREGLNATLGIFSASKYRNVSELWNSFAPQGSGFCVGFHTKKMFHPDEKNIDGYRVDYFHPDNPPKFKLFNHTAHEREKDTIKIVHTLPNKYEAECEYRLLRYEPSENKPIKVPSESYAEIILGENMTIDNKKDILEIVNDKYPNAMKFQAHKETDRYIFEII